MDRDSARKFGCLSFQMAQVHESKEKRENRMDGKSENFTGINFVYSTTLGFI